MKDRKREYNYKSVNGLMASNIIEYIYQGGREPETIRALIENLLNYVRARKDCADFRAAYLVRSLCEYEKELGPELYNEILTELLTFPYDDCGGHSMCTWTENHRLYTAGNELLISEKHPDAVFADGKDGRYHCAHAVENLERGFAHMLKYGFCEWGSNNYYAETMAGLANIVQFAKNESVRKSAKTALYMLVYDILSQTVYNNGYMYNPCCARAYVDNKTSSTHGNYLEPQIREMLGEKMLLFKDKEGCMIDLLHAKDEQGNPLFEIPESMLKLPSEGAKETLLKEGINIDDYGKEGFAEYSHGNVRYAFMAGAISDHRVIAHNIRYLCETGLIDDGMLKDLKPFGKPFLYKTGILKFIKRFVPIGFDGVSMEEGNIYTYTDRNYSVSAAYDYRVGQVLYQQNPLAVNLSHDISLFATLPFHEMGKTGSPGYWIGSAAASRAAAYRNFAACIFDVKHARFGLKKTHLFFPTGLFDETDLSQLSEGILMGTVSRVNVCVRTNPGVHFVPAKESLEKDVALYQDEKIPAGLYNFEYDLINEKKGFHFYVFEVDNTMDFPEFKELMKKRKLIFDEKRGAVDYSFYSACLEYKGGFFIDGMEYKPKFKRLHEIFEEKYPELLR